MSGHKPPEERLHEVVNRVCALTRSAELTDSQLAELINLRAFAATIWTGINDESRWKMNAELWRRKDEGGLTVGPVRHYSGQVWKAQRTGEHKDILLALEQANRDEYDKWEEDGAEGEPPAPMPFSAFLSSDAWKEGAIRDRLPEDVYKRLFNRSQVLSKKTGKPLREAKAAPVKPRR